MRLDVGPGLLQRSLNTGYNWSPQAQIQSFYRQFSRCEEEKKKPNRVSKMAGL